MKYSVVLFSFCKEWLKLSTLVIFIPLTRWLFSSVSSVSWWTGSPKNSELLTAHLFPGREMYVSVLTPNEGHCQYL